ncbi:MULTISPECIES: hypothetical protein [Rhodanobacter]|uniref:hypothetical protein n=1 Tax=Rhodanobacter TaxID=75309 RepID=UPI00048016C0|nr:MULTISPECIES: hypothetical protein [Rhodanobacter]TAN16805.1 MAG: hypothetical protein EPN35_09160 [Rhodanobacter sp.]UJJ54307.1 hypothetical protein LRK53_15315 [Rhodanobacter thiooxydans]
MNDFLWSSGQLGWGVFTLVVFTGLWWLLGDLYWRLQSVRIGRFLVTLATGWAVGVGLILLGFHLGSR